MKPEIIVVDRLPGSKLNPRIFFQLRDDLGVNLARYPMTEEREKEIEELNDCKGKIYCVKEFDYESYVYDGEQWHRIG